LPYKQTTDFVKTIPNIFFFFFFYWYFIQLNIFIS